MSLLLLLFYNSSKTLIRYLISKDWSSKNYFVHNRDAYFNKQYELNVKNEKTKTKWNIDKMTPLTYSDILFFFFCSTGKRLLETTKRLRTIVHATHNVC